ncbi:sushi, von Willebrand factor type A, EGF and pentraxin domain-containing protein 1-like [Halichondria panicea]|uniref:sushi, von Willebrand factor type A, EGF and pentraxin domain-containing protein 1-like n=1 Tax=Halichondria panicea TaxID=6063 RepID=UPI00312B93E1
MAVKIIVCLLLCAVAASASYVPYCISPQEKSTKQYAIGSRITYSCPKGSVLIGERIATCLLDKTSHQGYWSSPIPTCKITLCPRLPTIRYGTVSISGRRIGSAASYECNNGFLLVGESTRHCLSSGDWSGEAPFCKRRVVLCPKLSSPSYGSVSVTGLAVGSSASYDCNDGFLLVGTTTRYCLPTGDWSGEAPTCRPNRCPTLLSPKYGSVSITGLQVGSTATYVCNYGFLLVGVSTRHCLSSGDWSGEAPSCKREIIFCPKLSAPSYGRVSVTGLEVGSSATYECNDGFLLVGTITRYCLPTGEWSGEASTCRTVRCPKLSAPSYGSVTVSGLEVGSTATYECDDGFLLIGSSSRYCQQYGDWSGEAPICNPVRCPKLSAPSYGSVSVSGLQVGSTATYQCDDGFLLVGSSSRYCQQYGDWSGEAPICNPVRCPKLSAPSYGSVSVSGLQVGSTATYQCNDGFLLVGASTRYCQSSGDWSGKAPTCNSVLCPKLTPPFYGRVSTTGQQPGSSANYQCNDGFLLVGESSRQCLHSGQWSGRAPACKPIKCPLLSPIVNAKITGTGLGVGSTATHECFDGFVLVGVSVRKCLTTGQWSGEEPFCKPVSCPDLHNPNYGSVRQTGTTLDHVAYYNCNKGFQLVGGRVRRCLTTGHWSGQAPVCKEQGCGRPPKPVYGYVSFESTNYRAVATYYCDDGYAFSKKGAQHRVCLENGHWSGETPVCQPQYY